MPEIQVCILTEAKYFHYIHFQITYTGYQKRSKERKINFFILNEHFVPFVKSV